MSPNRALIIIGICVGGFIALYLIVFSAILPYFDSRQQLATAIARAQFQHSQDKDLLDNQPRVAAAWKKLLATNLNTQSDKAGNEINNVLFDWARSSGIPKASIKSNRPVQKGDFETISFPLTFETSSQNLSRFLLYIEATDLPLRIDTLTVNAPKQGVNDLKVSLTVSTVVFSPAPTKAAPKSSSGDES